MAINDVFNSLTFDGVNSIDEGVFITGEAIYDAPERDVDIIEIPGRNGDFMLDKGRWKNIDVTYKAGLFGSDQDGFADKVRSFRNLLASKKGYKRLTDTYHPDEYRLGTFINAFEVDTEKAKRAGEFDLVFNCKPQRFLTSGELEKTATNGGTIYNPTAYDASPLLMVWGYGDITVNGYDIELVNNVLGPVTLSSGRPATLASSVRVDFVSDQYNNGDSIHAQNVRFDWSIKPANGYKFGVVNSLNHTGASGSVLSRTDSKITVRTMANLDYIAGTSATRSMTATLNVRVIKTSDESYSNKTITLAAEANYNSSGYIKLSRTLTTAGNVNASDIYTSCGLVVVDSTTTTLGTPTYLDCDLGEAYKIESGETVSLNKRVDLGSDLPVLSPGSNTFTFDNTVTQLKVVPRWWVL